MADYKVRLVGSEVTVDGQTVKLHAATESGEKVSLTFPENEMEFLMAALAQAATASVRIREKDPSLKRVLPSETWELNSHKTLGGVLISFRMPGGMEMTFHISHEAGLQFEGVLAGILGLRPMPVPESN